DQCDMTYQLTDISLWLSGQIGGMSHQENVELAVSIGKSRGQSSQFTGANGQITTGLFIPESEPHNFIYTYLSKRKVTMFDQVVNLDKTRAVSINLQNIVSKVDRLANPDHPKADEYEALCKSVLGFRVSSLASPGGHQAGILVGGGDYSS